MPIIYSLPLITLPPTMSADNRVADQLSAIESTLADTIHLGEAMLTEFAQQTETFERAQAHTAAVVRDAQQAHHVVRAMQSTPYALWRWCVGWWTWLAGRFIAVPEANPSVSTTQSAPQPAEADDARDATTALLPASIEWQLHTLHAQAHALGEALDTHLHLLDHLDDNVSKGNGALQNVPFRTS